MKKRTDPEPGRRVSLRTIADAARVSVMTVSYALRGSGEVSEATRRRVCRVAESLGYRPDPLLSHLMQHLRANRTPKLSSNLAVLTDMAAPFVGRLIAGAQARAGQLGYGLDRLNPRLFDRRPGALTRTLEARGVSGVLLAPSAVPNDCRELLDWGRFAAVAMTYSIVEPRLHRVVTHHFDNAVRTFDILAGRGFRRIGFVMTEDMEFRTNHSYTAAYHRATNVGRLAALPILLLADGRETEIRGWFRRHRPDAVVLANAGQFRDRILPAVGQAAARRTAFATLDVEPAHPIAGMDQCFETIGRHAIDAVVAQIHRSERGLPSMPVVSMVEGHWSEGPGLYPLGKAD